MAPILLLILSSCGPASPDEPAPTQAEFKRVLKVTPASRLLVVVLEEGSPARAEEPRLWSTLSRLRERSLLLHGSEGLNHEQVELALFKLALAMQDAQGRVAVAAGSNTPSGLAKRLAPERDLGLRTRTPGHWWQDLIDVDQARFAATCVSAEDSLWDLLILRLEGLKDAGPWREGQSRILSRGGRRAQAMNLALDELLRRVGSSATIMVVATSENRVQVPTSIYLAGPGVKLDSLRPPEPQAPRRVGAQDLLEIAALLLGWRSPSATELPLEVELDADDVETWHSAAQGDSTSLKNR